jgi:flagellar M-ring protein FliF
VKRLHVAVLVDGVAKGEGKARTMVPRDAKELAQIESLAREAAGIESERGDKIEVHSVPFAAASPFAEEAEAAARTAWPVSRPIALGAAGGLAALIVMVLLLVRRRRHKAAQVALVPGLPVRVGELEAQLPGAAAVATMAGAAPLELPAVRGARERVLEAARTDAARAALVLSAWLSETPEAGGSR